ncbi:MAG: TatD family hydrolase [Oscillospiraceae bacterium]|nr:TatD family hydrolase [Oscillospiraceae bacterium]
MYFDTHAHLDDKAFDEDREAVIERILQAGVELVLDPGCDVQSSRKAAQIAESHEQIWFATGIHPEELADFTEDGLEQVFALAEKPKCAAIGEIGLDYYWDDSHKEEQKQLFHAQLSFARERDLPVIVHDREAHGDCLAIVKQYPGIRGVFHCYSGSAEMAEELLKMGWYLGFDGPVTYKNARKALEVLSVCPAERILIETDSPYLAPVPMRGKRNDPGNLPYICARVAEVKGLTKEEAARITLENGRALFRIGA